MARTSSQFVCQACGAVSAKWAGRCDACGAWNTVVEEAGPGAAPGGLKPVTTARAGRLELVELSGSAAPPPRVDTGGAEFDRVLGGGLVPGSAVLIGGDPGIGKSTLMLQTAAGLARQGLPVAYVSGEESAEQIRLRARRLGLSDAPVRLAAATSVREILSTLDRPGSAALVVIDSIQTMFVDSLESAPGTVAQLRTSAHELIRMAKRRDCALFLVGHVTKDGQIAGPRVLEHMVDAVLYFEGERGHQFRLLRAVKNRFGPANEIGVFEMRDAGLVEVANPSALFLAERAEDVAGAAVFAGLEGSRPVLVEVQALVAPSNLGTPRRAVVGWDGARLAMLLAVLEARCGLALGGRDVYLNVAGGLRVGEPAADLAVAAALVSALVERPVPRQTVVFGEVGLAGEVRSVAQTEARLREAAKLGFTRAVLPGGQDVAAPAGLHLTRVQRLADLLRLFRADPRARRDRTAAPLGSSPAA